MAGITRFEGIESWKTARQLTNMIYALSNQSGFNRDFGLRDQVRRAGVSVMSNIAEGFESRTDVQFINFLGMAKASAGEVRAQLYVALDQKYIDELMTLVKEKKVQLNDIISHTLPLHQTPHAYDIFLKKLTN